MMEEEKIEVKDLELEDLSDPESLSMSDSVNELPISRLTAFFEEIGYTYGVKNISVTTEGKGLIEVSFDVSNINSKRGSVETGFMLFWYEVDFFEGSYLPSLSVNVGLDSEDSYSTLLPVDAICPLIGAFDIRLSSSGVSFLLSVLLNHFSFEVPFQESAGRSDDLEKQIENLNKRMETVTFFVGEPSPERKKSIEKHFSKRGAFGGKTITKRVSSSAPKRSNKLSDLLK